ncbi:Uracil DNA glycosylase superfamily protein [uncultured archaeon]|nr:Uracil DNA glycosylase superfamily protein [uncultured archaeon]
MIPTKDAKKLGEIASEINACTLCPLSKTRTLAVPGEGPQNARILLVGEAPGRNEDKTGKPFAGAAGNILTEALTKAEINRADCFITSVIKCRPPGNRKPNDDEIDACCTHLARQIASVNPDVIVPLGNVALTTLTGLKNIGEMHGKQITMTNKTYVPAYHPAAVLYNRKLMEKLIWDLSVAASITSDD